MVYAQNEILFDNEWSSTHNNIDKCYKHNGELKEVITEEYILNGSTYIKIYKQAKRIYATRSQDNEYAILYSLQDIRGCQGLFQVTGNVLLFYLDSYTDVTICENSLSCTVLCMFYVY